MKALRIVEPFAGLGAYSLYAIAHHAGRLDHRRYRDKPPYSRMGSKAGFAPAVLRAWGLSRRPIESVWLNDTCTICQALWLSYASADFRDAVSAKIAAMTPCSICQPDAVNAALAGEVIPKPDTLAGIDGCPECNGTGVADARQLWERLRSAPVPEFGVELGAVGAFLQARAFGLKAIGADNAEWSDAGYNPELHPYSYNGKPSGHHVPRWLLGDYFPSLPPGAADFAAVGAFLQSRSFSLKAVGVGEDGWENMGFKPEWADHSTMGLGKGHPNFQTPRWQLAANLSTLPGPHSVPITMTGGDASLVLPRGDESNTLVILDPPYESTTGYADDSPRHAVLTLARAWHEAGALVLIHEAVGLDAELGTGWESRPAGVLRKGGASNFWKGGEEREFISFNRPPKFWPATQMGLF